MKARRVKKLDPGAPLAENAARIVRVRLAELRSFAPRALEAERIRDQHDMRIAAKRLRYVIEATELCFGRRAADAKRRARDLQDLLGELHDCDVMLPRVEHQLAELREADAITVRARAPMAEDLAPRLATRAPHRTSYRGLEILIVYLMARRRLLFDRFTRFWGEQEQVGTWERLDREMRDCLRKARQRRRAARQAAAAQRQLDEAERSEREAASQAASAAAELRRARRSADVARPEPPPPARASPPTRSGDR